MRKATILSATFHLAVVLIAWLGLPFLSPPPRKVDLAVPIEVIMEPSKNTAKREEPKPTPEPTPLAAAPPAPPPPPAPIEPPAPKPPEPRQETVPMPKVQPLKPEPPKEAAKIEPPPQLHPEPKEKPAPPTRNLMASVLKTVDQMRAETQKKEKSEPQAEKAAATAPPQMSSLDRQRVENQLGALVRQQMKQCWNFDPGGKDARHMVAEIRIQLAPDGTVQRAEALNAARATSDAFYQAFVESTLRAVLNPRCNPMKLPPESYDIWRDMRLVFSPKDLA